MEMAAFNHSVWSFSLSFHETLEETLKLSLNLVQFYFWCFRLSRLIVFVTTKKEKVRCNQRRIWYKTRFKVNINSKYHLFTVVQNKEIIQTSNLKWVYR